MKVKKIPMRRCVGCGEMKPKKELTRIVANADGEIKIDNTGKAAGRGAYICRQRDCLTKAYSSHGLERSLKRQVPQEIYEALMEAMP